MGFLTGRVSCLRFKVDGANPRTFGPDTLEHLSANAIGKQRIATADGSQCGWIAGDHILDTSFDLAKNVVNDALVFSLRVDEQKVPSSLFKAYRDIELKALAANNPSGHPSSKQKKQAREYARDRLEEEAKDGRFLKHKAYELLWDARSNELLVGATSPAVLDRLISLFHATFQRKFELLGAGRQAFNLAELSNQTRHVDNAKPTAFTPGGQVDELAWSPDENSRDFLGNEFLLWLWHTLENQSDTIKLSDDSEVALMIARSLQLECPRGQNGKDSMTSEGPSKLPEATRAIQAGKLPRKMGLTLVRHEVMYELTLNAESLAIQGAKLPKGEEEDDQAKRNERVDQVRHLLETMDLLYQAFLEKRLSSSWERETGSIKKWLSVPRQAA